MKLTCFVVSVLKNIRAGRWLAGLQPGLQVFFPGGKNTRGLLRLSLWEMGLGTGACPEGHWSFLISSQRENINPYGSWNEVLMRTLGFRISQNKGEKVEVFSPAPTRATDLPIWRSRAKTNNHHQDNTGSGSIPIHYEWENNLAERRHNLIIMLFSWSHFSLFIYTM